MGHNKQAVRLPKPRQSILSRLPKLRNRKIEAEMLGGSGLYLPTVVVLCTVNLVSTSLKKSRTIRQF